MAIHSYYWAVSSLAEMSLQSTEQSHYPGSVEPSLVPSSETYLWLVEVYLGQHPCFGSIEQPGQEAMLKVVEQEHQG